MFEACSWSSALLAAQRREGDAAAGEARYQGVNFTLEYQNSQNGQKIAGFDKRYSSRSLLLSVSIHRQEGEAETQDLNTSVQVDFSRRYTLEEFWALPKPEDGSHYDLIDGYLYRVPPPDPSHAKLAANMGAALTRFLEVNKIDGEVHFPPEPIYRRVEGATDPEPD